MIDDSVNVQLKCPVTTRGTTRGCALDEEHDGSVLGDIAGMLGGGAGAGTLKHVLGGKQNEVAQVLAERPAWTALRPPSCSPCLPHW